MTKPDPDPTLRALQGAHRATHSHFLISTHHGKRDAIDDVSCFPLGGRSGKLIKNHNERSQYLPS
jgi:hypothetical protein